MLNDTRSSLNRSMPAAKSKTVHGRTRPRAKSANSDPCADHSSSSLPSSTSSGLQQMIEEERNCVDVAHQIAALRRVQGDMLRDHLAAIAEAAIAGTVSEPERHRLVDEGGAQRFRCENRY